MDEVGFALGFSEIVRRSNITFARNFRQCGGKSCCSWGGVFQLIKCQTKKPGRFDSLVPLQAFSPRGNFQCRLSHGVCPASVCHCMHQYLYVYILSSCVLHLYTIMVMKCECVCIHICLSVSCLKKIRKCQCFLCLNY